MHVDLKRKFIAACEPDQPLRPDDPRYFDFDHHECRLRGVPWLERLATVIRLSAEPSAQLVTGLRGSGKTTELRQLQQALRTANYHVVMADAGEWISNERPISTADLMLALLLSLYPDGDEIEAWERDYATRVQKFLSSEAELEADVDGVRLQLTDKSLFERVARRLRSRAGLRRQIHALLGDAAEASRNHGRELVILLDGGEQRATGQLHEGKRRSEFHDHWVGAFILGDRDLRPPVHVVYTVPPFMVRRGSELAAGFGAELYFLPSVRIYERDSTLDVAGVEALAQALFRRIPEQHFADEHIPRWLAARSGGRLVDMLRIATEMVYQVADAPQFTRDHAQAAVTHIRQTNLAALVREDKQVLRKAHSSRALPDEEASRARTEFLLQSSGVVRYQQHGEAWYDGRPLCWPQLGFADDLPSWDQLADG